MAPLDDDLISTLGLFCVASAVLLALSVGAAFLAGAVTPEFGFTPGALRNLAGMAAFSLFLAAAILAGANLNESIHGVGAVRGRWVSYIAWLSAQLGVAGAGAAFAVFFLTHSAGPVYDELYAQEWARTFDQHAANYAQFASADQPSLEYAPGQVRGKPSYTTGIIILMTATGASEASRRLRRRGATVSTCSTRPFAPTRRARSAR